ncbi:MAG: sodium-dependent transporter, partial [Lentisphaeria bacterium]
MAKNTANNNTRGSWASQWGFILAAIGSAVGLGNVWRFPYMAYDNGGFAFLIPYLVALFVVGLPILILEFGIGHHMRASAPLAFRKVNSRFGWLGWWSVTFVMFGIVVYYAVVISWCINYFFLSFKRFWGSDPATFFEDTFLQLNQAPVPETSISLGAPVLWIIGALAVVWITNWVITAKEIEKGIEKACRIFIPLLLVVITVLVVWALTFDGAMSGVSMYLNPLEADWSKLTEPGVWVSAISQIFFTLSVGFGIMIAYASYLPKNANVARSALITAVGNCAFSVFAGLAVFATIGFMAASHDVPVRELEESRLTQLQATEEARQAAAALPADIREKLEEGVSQGELENILPQSDMTGEQLDAITNQVSLALSGPGLVFKTYPVVLNKIPGGALFGLLFFAALTVAGISSSVSIVEAFSSSLRDHFNISRARASTGLCTLAFIAGIPFATGTGLYLLDLVDHFLTQYGLVVVGIMESLIIGWFFTTRRLRSHLDEAADVGFSNRGDVIMRIVLTVLLGLTWYGLARSGNTDAVGTQVAMLAVLATIFFVWIEEHWLDFDMKIVIPAMLIFIINGALLEEFSSDADGGYYGG